MDIAGIVLGAASLAGLLENCINLFNRVDTYRQYGWTSTQLEIKFKSQRLRFKQWVLQYRAFNSKDQSKRSDGQTRGVSIRATTSSQGQEQQNGNVFSESLDSLNISTKRGDDEDQIIALEQERFETLQEILLCMIEALRRINASLYGTAADVSNPAPSARHVSKRFRVIERIKWATGGKESLTEQIDWFDGMLATLYVLAEHSAARPRRDSVANLELPSMADIEAVRSWLNPPDPRMIYDLLVEARVDGTCQWILQLHKFREWLDGKSPWNTLWMHAPPGFGKSVTAAALSQEIGKQGVGCVLTYFCSSSDSSLMLPSSTIRFLVGEAVLDDPELYSLAGTSKQRGHSSAASETDLWSLFDAVLNARPNTYIIIDGFDECEVFESDKHRRLGRDREAFLHRLVTSVSATQCRLLIMSRDQDDIRAALKQPSSPRGVQVGEYAIERRDLQMDIEQFAKHQVQRLPGLARWKQQTKELIIKHLVEQSDGMFLYILLQSQELAKASSAAELKSLMTTMPKGLDGLYEKDWGRIQGLNDYKRSTTQRILRWVTFAARPLTVDDILELIAIDDSTEPLTMAVDRLPEDRDDIDSILQTCKPFLGRQRGPERSLDTVQLAHASMRSFLLHEFGNDGSRPLIDAEVAALCVRYLTSGLSIRHLSGFGEEDKLQHHYLKHYINLHWISHLDINDPRHETVVGQLDSWFFDQGPSWQSWRTAYMRAELSAVFPLLPRGDTQSAMTRQSLFDTLMIEAGPLYYLALFGFQAILERHINASADHINDQGGFHGTALHAACTRPGRAGIVRSLIAAGAQVETQAGVYLYALHAAVSTGDEEIVKVLIETSRVELEATARSGRTALMEAAHLGQLFIVKRLWQAGAAINTTDEDLLTPLIISCARGHSNVVKFLLSIDNIDIHSETLQNVTALSAAVEKDSSSIVTMLLSSGAGTDINRPRKDGFTPLLIACAKGSDAIVKLCVDSGADFQFRTKGERCALCLAASEGHLKVVEMLLTAEASETAEHSPEEPSKSLLALLLTGTAHERRAPQQIPSSAETAIEERKVSLTMARRYPPCCRRSKIDALVRSAHRGYVKVVQLLLQHGAAINETSSIGWHPLYAACDANQLDIVQCLLEAGAEIDKLNVRGVAAVHIAAFRNHTGILNALIEAGCDLEIESKQQNRPLHLACENGSYEAAKLLCSKRVSLHAMNNGGWDAVRLAAESGHVDLVGLLLSHGADVNSTERNGRYCGSAIRAAVLGDRKEVVSFLLNNGASIPIDEPGVGPAIHLAAEAGALDLVRKLINDGVDPSSGGYVYGSAVLAAMAQSHHEVVQYFDTLGVTIKQCRVDGLGRSLIHFAAINGVLPAIAAALEDDSNIDMPDKQQWTALHWAAYFGSATSVEFLIKHGADLERTNTDGETAYQTALYHNNSDDVKDILPLLARPSDISPPATADDSGRLAICDCCKHDIYKVRYRCMEEPDYDLCFRCVKDADVVHPGHRIQTVTFTSMLPEG